MHSLPTSAAIPADVLHRPDMRDAISRHDFGRVFALARQWAGISFSRISEVCAIKSERVGTLARGQGRITSYEKITVIADGLRIPGGMLGLAPRPWEIPTPPSRATSNSPDRGDEVQRRHFLRASLASATVAVGLAEALNNSTIRPLGAELPDMLRRRTARLRKLDDVLGGGDTFQIYHAEYRSTKSLVTRSPQSGSARANLFAVLAEQAQQAGWAAFDMGDHANARRLYTESRSIAAEAGSDILTGNALAFLAYLEVVENPSAAVITAEESCAVVGARAPSTARALLHERRAWAHAVVGDARSADAALAAAQHALADDDGSPQPDWSRWVDQQELQIMSGRCWTELRRPLRAVPVLEAVLKGFDDTRARDKALYSCWLADSYLMAGEVEAAATTASRVLSLSDGVASVRPRQRLQPILDELTGSQGVPEVRQVLEQAGATRQPRRRR